MKKTACHLVALLILFSLVQAKAYAASPSPEMFAYGMELAAEPDHALYEIALPLAVYQGVTRGDLGDLRIFNKAGQIVPHALRQPQSKTARPAASSRPLPFFPLSGGASQAGADLGLSLRRDSAGAIMDLKLTAPAGPEKTHTVTGYLVDASARKQGIDSLILSWPDSASDFFTKTVLEKSNDLAHWESVATVPVAQLNHLGRRLVRNTIDFAPTIAKYYRLTWAQDQPPLAIAGISAQSQVAAAAGDPQRNWHTATASPAGQKPFHYLVDLQGPLPVERVKIRLQDANAVASVSLSSGPTPDKAEKMHWRGLVYNLTVDGENVAAPAMAVGVGRHRYWMLTIDQAESSLSRPPVLEFGWQPQRLLFVAQGEGPFMLAYGSKAVEPDPLRMGGLLDKLKDDNSRTINPKIITPGPQFSINEKNLRPGLGSLPWRKYILWATLGAGVLLIGWLSRKLYRQLRGGKAADQ
ncbi:DUF3999 domain-containing protein [Thiovibrio sp. JS02]